VAEAFLSKFQLTEAETRALRGNRENTQLAKVRGRVVQIDIVTYVLVIRVSVGGLVVRMHNLRLVKMWVRISEASMMMVAGRAS